MTTTALILIGGCLLGVMQLAVGVAIGWWLRRPAPGNRDADLHRARSLALQLHGMTQQIGIRVADHRSRFEAAEQRLNDVPAGKRHPTTDLVVGVVGEILAANRQLQSELAAAEHQIADQAREIESHLTSSLTDSLTKLPNRRALDEQLVARLQDYRKHGTPFSLLMIDADHFKQINDTFGHPAGDQVLCSMASALQTSLRKQDFVARYGGEEFAVVLPHTTLDEAQRAAGKAHEGVTVLSSQFGHFDRSITTSAGIASIQPGENIESLICRADQALYVAKQRGRNRTYLHDGTDCQPLDRDLASSEPWKPAADIDADIDDALDSLADDRPSAEPDSPALAEACDGLRAAMMATVGSEGS